MFEFLFGNWSISGKSRNSAPKRRSLQLESLESRELLSVSPLDFAPMAAETAFYAEMTPQTTTRQISTEAVTKLDPLTDVKVVLDSRDSYTDQGHYTVSWTRPSSQWNCDVEYQLSSDNGATWESTITIGRSDWFRLPPDTVWLLRVRAVYEGNSSYAPSDWSETFTLKLDSTKAPSDPYNLTAKKQVNGSLLLNWEDRSYNETGFELQRSTDNGTTWETVQTIARDNTSTLVSSPGENDRYRLCAVNDTGKSAWLTISTKLTLDAPTGLTATWKDPDPDSWYSWSDVELSWNAVEGATEYVIQRSITGSNKWEDVSTWKETNYSDTSFFPQENQTYRILAKNAVTTSVTGSTADIYCPTGSFSHPLGITVVSKTFSAIQLSWKALEGALTYEIYRYNRADPNESWSPAPLIGTTTGLTFTDTNQKKGAVYEYRIWAYDAQGNKMETEALTQTAKEDPPVTPSAVKGTAIDSETISLSWKQAGTTTWRIVECSLTGTGNWEEIGLLDETDNSAVIGYLSPLTKYYFRVAVENSEGKSSFSTPIAVTTKAAIPETVDICEAVAQSDKIVNLSWDAVEHATSYIVERSTDYGDTWKKVATVIGKTEYTDKSLKGCTEYYYRITAVSTAGKAEPGGDVNVMTRFVSPAAPTLKIVNGEVNVSWRAVKDVYDYQVERSVDGTTWTTVNESTTATSFVDRTVAGNTSYSYRIVANGSDELTASAPSAVKTIKTAPENPTDLQLKSVADKTATLTWAAVEGATSYKIEKFVNGKWSSAGTSKTTEATVKSLKPLTDYPFRVIAVSKAGASAPGETLTVKTIASTPKAPTVRTQGSTSVSLAWGQVMEATGYQIQRTLNGTTTWETVGTIAVSAKPTFLDTGLTANTAYQYRIIALGDSVATNSLPSVASKPATTAPATPTNVVATPADKTVALTWNSVPGATSYKIEKYVNGRWSSAGTSKTASLTVKSLKPSTNYTYRVTAVSRAGSSTPTEGITVTTLS